MSIPIPPNEEYPLPPISDGVARHLYLKYFQWGDSYAAKLTRVYQPAGFDINPIPYPYDFESMNHARTVYGLAPLQYWFEITAADIYIDEYHQVLPSQPTPYQLQNLGDLAVLAAWSQGGLILWYMWRIGIAGMLQDAYNVGSGGPGGNLGPLEV